MNCSSAPIRIGRGMVTSAAPVSQMAWMAVTSWRVVGPSRATWSPGSDAPGLEAGRHGPGLVVELRPADRVVRRHPRRT